MSDQSHPLPSLVNWAGDAGPGEDDELCLEWFNGDRRLTAFVGVSETHVLMSDSPRVEEMRYVRLEEVGGWTACLAWLGGAS